ncbi:MAG: patatin-like phospholipase family protein [Hyphomicrobium sp.]
MTPRRPAVHQPTVPTSASRRDVARQATPTASPKIGLALGGGGARGLGHIVMLEAFDELGVRPSVIAGTSIGAIYGAAYASGVSGKELRAHTREILSQRFGLVRDLFAARAQPFQRFFNPLTARSAFLDAAAVVDVILPKAVKSDFSELETPLKIVASAFYEQEQVVFTQGAVRTAVAASMALPVIFQPVVRDGRTVIDGGLTNPLPFDLLIDEADVVVAIDVSGAPTPDPRRQTPTAFEALFASAFLFEKSIVREKLKSVRPDILISAGTSQFLVLEFLKYDEILAAAEPAKERLKTQLARVLSVETLPQLEAHQETPIAAPKKKRGFLSRKPKGGKSGDR